MKMSTLQKSFGLGFLLLSILSFSSTQAHAGCTYEKVFSGEELEVGIMLTWSTSNEESNSMFILEKAEDGGEFTSVGSISGAGDSNNLEEYTFFDIDLRGQYILYRLRQVDYDGTESISKTLFISKENNNNFMVATMSDVMPSDKFEVSIDVIGDNYLEYLLVDSQNEVVLQEGMSIQSGINDIIIDLNNTDEGIYKLLLRIGEEQKELTFHKIYDPNKQTKTTARKN